MCALTYLLYFATMSAFILKLLICVHAFVVFNYYLFLYCVCRSKAH
jgi:hypothetical protein